MRQSKFLILAKNIPVKKFKQWILLFWQLIDPYKAVVLGGVILPMPQGHWAVFGGLLALFFHWCLTNIPWVKTGRYNCAHLQRWPRLRDDKGPVQVPTQHRVGEQSILLCSVPLVSSCHGVDFAFTLCFVLGFFFGKKNKIFNISWELTVSQAKRTKSLLLGKWQSGREEVNRQGLL